MTANPRRPYILEMIKTLKYFHCWRLLMVVVSVSLTLTQVSVALDKARVETRVEEVHNELGMDGEGVIVAILDRGIDWKNNDFRNEDGTTRIKYILDFTNDRQNGDIFTEEEINEALANNTELPTRDAVGHGTTTTGIAAGSGRNSVDGKFRGMAPKASLIAVKVTSDGAPAHGDQPAEASFFGFDLVTKGMDFVVEKAAELGMPVVMLPNLGSNGGPTDGTSSFSRKIDSIVGEGIPGIAFINGPGDEGGGANRAQATINPGQTISLEVEKGQAGGITVDLWYPTIGPGEAGLEFTIKDPVGNTYGPYPPIAGEGFRDSQLNVGGIFDYYHNGRDTDFSLSTNQKRQVFVRIYGNTGTYTIDIKRPEGAPDAKEFIGTLNFSNYSQNPQNAFKTFLVPGNVWDGATAFNNISPTNYVLQKDWTDLNGVSRSDSPSSGSVGDIWAGSSIGPTFDGRLGVDVAAPGEFVMTTYAPNSNWARFDFNINQEGDGLYGKANAVSAAAPQVTGIVALMLQANPELDQIQIREILRNTARADEFTGDVPNNTWGYGKIDAYEAVKAAIASASADAEIYTTIVLTGDDPQLTFTSFLGLSYRIEYKDEMNDAEWIILASGLAATGKMTIYVDETLGENNRRFYRICVE